MADRISLIERAKWAYGILRGKYPTPRTSAKAPPFAWPVYVDGKLQWQMLDFDTYAREGFNQNALIYSAIMYKVRAITSAKLGAFRGDPKHPEAAEPTHRLAALLSRPNFHQSSIEFLQQAIVYQNVAGNLYIYLDRNNKNKGYPTALYNLRPDRVKIVPGDKMLKGYMYFPNDTHQDGFPILPEDMIHVKYPNPLDPLEGMGYGLSPISPSAQSGDADNSLTKMLKTLLDNGTMLGGVLSFNVPMDDDTMAAAKRRWQELYGGVQNWGQVAVLDNQGSFTPLQADLERLSFKNVDGRNEARVLGPLGVPGMLIGMPGSMERSTYANFEQADKVFWQNTFIPELSLVQVELQFTLTDNGVYPAFDTSGVPALQKNVQVLIDSAFKMWQMGTPRDVAYATVGLNVPETEGGQIGYIPMNMIPVGTTPKPQPPKPVGQPSEEDGGKALPQPTTGGMLSAGRKSQWTAEQKTAIWKSFDSIATSWESRFKDGAKKQFDADKREILALVSEAKQKAIRLKATINWLDVEDDVKAYLDSAGKDGWKTTFTPLLSGVVEDGGNFWSTQLGLEFDIRNLLGEAWFQDYTLKFAQPINQTTSDTIHDILAQAQKEGWSIPDMQKNLEALFKQWMNGDLSASEFQWFNSRLPAYRTEFIARTETTRAENAGADALFKDWNISQREWLATHDDRTRDTHAKADGQVQDMDTPFDIGSSQMMYPGDADLGAPPEEFINCRCTILPIVPDSAGG